MELGIKHLCIELLNTHEPDEAEEIGGQLRLAIHECIENLRDEVIALPVVNGLAA